jgi:hypothetical protein
MSVSAIATWQRAFLAALVTGDDARAAALVRPGNCGAEARLGIYRHTMRGNRRAALRSAYPVVAALVGEAFFDEAADRFAEAEPSRSGDLHRFGPGLAAFLAAYPHAAGLPYLPDVARLEWAWHESFHAAEHAPLDFARLAGVPEERYGDLRFRLHPSARLVRSGHPVLAIWNAHQEGGTGAADVDLDAGGERVLVFRGDADTRMFALPEADWSLLAGMEQGAALDDLAALPLPPDEGDFLGAALRRWTGEGVIVAISLAEAGEAAR